MSTRSCLIWCSDPEARGPVHGERTHASGDQRADGDVTTNREGEHGPAAPSTESLLPRQTDHDQSPYATSNTTLIGQIPEGNADLATAGAKESWSLWKATR